MSDDATARLDQADEVRDEERFDPERLRPHLEAVFPGATGPVSLLQFRKGHSNLTYLVRIGEREAVLRRAPFGAAIAASPSRRAWPSTRRARRTPTTSGSRSS